VSKRFEYSATVDRDGRCLLAEERAPLSPPEPWTPEHLVLAALGRCTLASLRFHAERLGVAAHGAAVASGVVMKQADDGRYAFVELQCGLDVELDPAPDDLGELLDLAERDCFVSASLTARTEYEWRVNGEVVDRGAP
jgi:uncharacterized OsmC-like protein